MILLGLAWIAIPGCSSPTDTSSPAVDIRTDRSSYEVGDEIEVRITNRDRVAINIHHSSPGLCRAAVLERFDGAKWVFQDGDLICSADAKHLELQPHLTVPVHRWVFQPGERYRFAKLTSVGKPGNGSLQYSNVFAVRR